MPQQADPHRRRREEDGDAFLLDQPQHQSGSRRLDQHRARADHQLRHGEGMHLRRVIQRQRRQRAVARRRIPCCGYRRSTATSSRDASSSRLSAPPSCRRYRRSAPANPHAAADRFPRASVSACAAASTSSAPPPSKRPRIPLSMPARLASSDGAAITARAPGLAHDVGKFLAGQRVVHRHMHEAAAHAAKPGDEIGVGVAAVAGNTIAGLQSRLCKPLSDAIRGAVQFGKAPVPVAKHQRCAVAMHAGGTPQRVTHRVAARAVDPMRVHSVSSSTSLWCTYSSDRRNAAAPSWRAFAPWVL